MLEEKDLTKGNLLNNMIKFSIPLLMSKLLNTIYNIVDGIWIGRLIGDSALAATTNCWPIILLADAMLTAVTVTTSILVSHYFTSSTKERIKDIMTPMYIISLLVGIITAIILILSEEFLFNFFKTPIEVIEDAKKYINIYLIGFIFNFAGYTAVSAIRSIGNSKTPLAILTITEVLNIILDPILIKRGLGIEGVAFATFISMFVMLILSYLYTRKSQLLKFDIQKMKLKKSFLKHFIKLAIPIGAQSFFTIFTIILEVSISNSLGIVGASTYGIVSKFQELVWILGSALSELITVIIGQFIGKKEYSRIKDVLNNGIKLAIPPMIITAIFIIFFSNKFAEIFTNNYEIISNVVAYLHVVGIGYTIVPICQLLCGFILGIGDTKYSFAVNFVATITEIVIALILFNLTHKAFLSLGIGITLWYTVEIIIFAIYYFSKRWYKTEF